MTGRPRTPSFDAVVLAGGRGERLGGAAKPLLEHDGSTLLGHALAAVAGARRVVVAGPPELRGGVGAALLVQEEPAFGGPVAGLAAALPLLARDDAAGWIAVLAADLVDPAPALDRLLADAASADPATDALLAVDGDGRAQLLLGLHRRAALTAAVTRLPAVDGASVRALLAGLAVRLVEVPAGSTADVDDRADARRHGIAVPGAESARGAESEPGAD
ncbi:MULTISPECIES: NTP transferase domain-containing protein [unclassified Rathayibacter]|uniref:molybdenum cofactor guanylyltransferase n=1 Tax=unclassified Rathayibacter TaxID=2609250 RepID=UPI0010DEDEAD|nr:MULTISPECIES: NTP transferase domain-containing protein [unclassified Rathayibacter]TCL81388.1 molybdopterin-guanine dinucleotide biosynthesis protein A [Rathayibacter sp. PhB192]TCM26352.1 molybdopterin-guanine dinucleotide biosynthesis protein A [Rathayibacter sp. PhB179]